jgi:endoglucanase
LFFGNLFPKSDISITRGFNRLRSTVLAVRLIAHLLIISIEIPVMKTTNALLVLSIASLLSACGGSGSGSGASSSSVSSMVESVSSQSSAVSVDASSVDASSSSLASSVADVSSSSPAISSVDMSSSGLAMSSVAMSSSSVITISSADASSSSLATSSIAASSSSLAISSSSIEASSSSLVSSSSVASSSSLAASSASTALYPSYNTNPIAPDMTGMESDAVQLAAKMKLGINVGNQMEATNCPQLELTQRETCWGHPKVSEAYIQLVRTGVLTRFGSPYPGISMLIKPLEKSVIFGLIA